ncbi:MAG: phosphodiester glycosidase family protein [Desulfovibrio sp.]|nr:phosphodiester glycosidase family protein [Desulfovibrio sp.]
MIISSLAWGFFLLLLLPCPALAAEGKNEVQAAGESVRNDMRVAEKTRGEDSLGLEEKGRAQWLELEPGLDFGEFRLDPEEAKITALRIDPDRFDFLLGSSSRMDGKTRTLGQWARDIDLAAAINASMYLPDGSTSTGYMRHGEHVNNPRIAGRFGAFFVAGPKRVGLPRAAIIDRDMPDWRKILEDYDLVVQNYRMINSKRRILWSPGGPLYSISAVAQDGKGRILFLHSRSPVEAYSFAQQLLHLPLDVRTVMYVEGGAQAGLLVRTDKLSREISGAHAPSLLITGNLKAPLPNILGARRQASKKTLQIPASEAKSDSRE